MGVPSRRKLAKVKIDPHAIPGNRNLENRREIGERNPAVKITIGESNLI